MTAFVAVCRGAIAPMKTLDTQVLNLRRKPDPGAITTLRGVGYRFEAP